MVLIRDLIQEALETGYLNGEIEGQLRELLEICHSDDDFEFLMELEPTLVTDRVQQQPRQQKIDTNLKRAYQITALIAAMAITLSIPGSIETAVVGENLSSTTSQLNFK